MKIKEFILKYCQHIKYPYKNFIIRGKLLFNSNTITPNEDTLNSLGLRNFSTIECVL